MASDLVFHCLSMSHKKDARLKWVKQYPFLMMTIYQTINNKKVILDLLVFCESHFAKKNQFANRYLDKLFEDCRTFVKS